MARCPECRAAVPAEARFCAECGAALMRMADTPPLFGPLHVPAYAGAGAPAAPAMPLDTPGLSMKQVLTAVTLIGLFLLFIFLYVGRPSTAPPAPPETPVLGRVGEAVTVGGTVWGVAFTDRPAQFGDRAPRRGQFVVVGVVAGNRSAAAFTLAGGAAALQDGATGTRYTPIFIAWGTPDDFSQGRYLPTYTLPPRDTAAGLLVFDVPKDLAHPRLLVRDLAEKKDFVGAIDLEQEGNTQSSKTAVLLSQ